MACFLYYITLEQCRLRRGKTPLRRDSNVGIHVAPHKKDGGGGMVEVGISADRGSDFVMLPRELSNLG